MRFDESSAQLYYGNIFLGYLSFLSDFINVANQQPAYKNTDSEMVLH